MKFVLICDYLLIKQTRSEMLVCVFCFNGLVWRQDWKKCLSLHNIVIERTLCCDAVDLAYNCDFMFHGSFVVASLWFLLRYVDQSCVGGFDAMFYTLLYQWDEEPGTRSVLIPKTSLRIPSPLSAHIIISTNERLYFEFRTD